MIPNHAPRRAILAGTLAGLMVAGTVPASAVNIPEGGAVTPDSVFLFHLRVIEGCEGLPMDSLEVTIPEAVGNPTPAAVAGWDTTIEVPGSEEGATEGAESAEASAEEDGTAEEVADEEAAGEEGASEEGAEEDEPELTVIRWEGGSLEDGLLQDFGIRARFPDEPDAVIEFPVVKRCGDVAEEYAPTVRLTTRYGQGEISALADSVDQLRADVDVLREDVDSIQNQVGQVNVTGLRNRVEDLEETVVELDERVTGVEEAEDEPDPAPAE